MTQPPKTPDTFDVAVIGAGVVGIATARALAALGQRVVVLEKGTDLLSGASKANSAILHTGFDAPPGSLEAQCVRRGHALYMQEHARYRLGVVKTGALVVAWDAGQAAHLQKIAAQALENEVTDIALLSPEEVAKREPNLAPGQHGAVWVPQEYLIDPWTPFYAYAREAQIAGAQFRFDSPLTGGAFDGATWTLETPTDRVNARQVVNCAGLFGDYVEALCLGQASFEIRPRKGQFVVFDKAAAALVNAILLPVPNERTKGIVLTRTAFGNLLVGPTAEEQEDRERPTTSRAMLEELVARAVEMVPRLAGMDITATYAGLRPASEEKPYRIRHEPDRHWLTLGGIRSTGMTASLGLAEYAAELLLGQRPPYVPPEERMPALIEGAPRDWQSPGYGEILCHCEMVTRREVEAALQSPLPPRSPGGLRRRTRCAMGRCQGFNCFGALAEITDQRLPHPFPGAKPCK
ncbi:NAD(P)/FAD-dependent oxidoreductase [Arenibacterium sp. LLYu02]|uniref:NAD(P)/FAD-dependent oxidoreductase n=1 Tax=Arenibacterium sp. LLYu02 TaxID=3404132 RepID=UPI003B213249